MAHSHSDMKRYRLQIRGIVQGVGFRPFLYRLACQVGLGGYVCNDGGGVTAELEGVSDALDLFFERLRSELPPLARIDSIETREVAPLGERSFKIVASDDKTLKATALSPDMTVCEKCLKEMRDPSNRRYLYPFINCTECGPRYTITVTVPYDRPNTSMARFKMCPKCRREYEDPLDRRYHAQPISCYECGPRLALFVGSEEERSDARSIVRKTAQLLKEGRIVAVKGLGGFHLMCDATNGEALRSLRERKRRPSKPLAVMVKDLQSAAELAQIGTMEEDLLTSGPRPIVLLKKSSKTPEKPLSDSVAPGIDRIGIMLPYTPLHHLLFDHLDIPLVATSANLSDEPIIRSREELLKKLGGVVDAVLDHDRDIVNACDDSVVQVAGSRVQWLRVARGIAPLTIPLESACAQNTLAVGANQKDTIALAFDEKIILSPHIGDLGSIEAMEYFERTVETFKRFYDFEPKTVVRDKHPYYETVKWSENLRTSNSALRTQTVQHHHAHALAVMAEHKVTESVLAFVWDGTGYGDDATVWGGETLLCGVKGFERVGHLRPFRLLGGEKAVREPRRSALSLLFECYTLEEILQMDSPAAAAFNRSEIVLLHRSWQKRINSPVTTSMGRLFDAAASLAGICQRVSYEGESGLRLEAAVKGGIECEALPMVIDDGIVDWRPAVRAIVETAPNRIAERFIASLVAIVVRYCEKYPKFPVVLSGGVFQNRTLSEAVLEALESTGRRVLTPLNTPPNDGSIALGQVWYALHSLKDGDEEESTAL